MTIARSLVLHLPSIHNLSFEIRSQEEALNQQIGLSSGCSSGLLPPEGTPGTLKMDMRAPFPWLSLIRQALLLLNQTGLHNSTYDCFQCASLSLPPLITVSLPSPLPCKPPHFSNVIILHMPLQDTGTQNLTYYVSSLNCPPHLLNTSDHIVICSNSTRACKGQHFCCN